MDLVINRIKKIVGGIAEVNLSDTCYAGVAKGGIVPVKDLGWTAEVNGDFQREYTFNNAVVTSLWNAKDKTSFFVDEKIALACYKKRDYVPAKIDRSAFK